MYDAIIIGSGFGGLSSAATLAKAGKKILLLESHVLLGGCATCFKRKGIQVEVSLHEMDFGKEGLDMKHTLFKELDLFSRIEFLWLPSVWSIMLEESRERLTIPHQKTKDFLMELFPKEKRNIDKYFKKLHFQAFLNRKFPFMMGFWEFFFAPITTLPFLAWSAFSNRSTGWMLKRLFKTSKLQKILNINLGYYHHSPFKLNWNYHAVAQNNYYHSSAYIKGGSQSLSNALCSIIKENGGEILTQSQVTRILTNGNKVIGVAYENKKANAVKKSDFIFGKCVIANCDPHQVYTKMLPFNATLKDRELTKSFTRNTSLLSIYMIFDRDLSEQYKDMDYSTFIIKQKYFEGDFNEQEEDLLNTSLEDRGFIFVNYSKVQSNLSAKENRFLGTITTISTYKEWEVENYAEKKEHIKTIFLERLNNVFPRILEYCIHAELATPKTIESYVQTYNGVVYGYDQSFEGFFGRERFFSKSFKNLYFASSFGFPGGGFTGAMLSGYRTAKKILNPYFYLKRLSLCFVTGVLIGVVVFIMIS